MMKYLPRLNMNSVKNAWMNGNGLSSLSTMFTESYDEKTVRNWLGRGMENNTNTTSSSVFKDYTTLSVSTTNDGIITIGLNRPLKMNAFNMEMWSEMEDVFHHIHHHGNAKVVILQGEGQAFSTGMDLSVFSTLQSVLNSITCEARKREMLKTLIERWQNIISLPEKCRVPVIAKISGYCYGAGVDLVTACDLLYCDKNTQFSVKEIDLAIVADLGKKFYKSNLDEILVFFNDEFF